jgi:hypothetical protein
VSIQPTAEKEGPPFLDQSGYTSCRRQNSITSEEPAENDMVKKKMTGPPPVMSGGMKDHVIDFSKQHLSQTSTVVLALMILGITFISTIPLPIRNQANTTIGRLLLFLLLVVCLEYGSWLHGILFAVFAALLIAVTPLPTEGFHNDQTLQIITEKKRWWVEEILHENPIGISDEKVSTVAVQDNNLQTKSSVQDSKSSSK